MRLKLIATIPGIWLALLMSSAVAHHGTAPYYDHEKSVKVTGVVTKFAWRNPHSTLMIEGKSDTGVGGIFTLEMGAPSALVNNYGIFRKTFKPGDQVEITMWPSYTSPTFGQLKQGHFWVNGEEFHSLNGKD